MDYEFWDAELKEPALKHENSVSLGARRPEFVNQQVVRNEFGNRGGGGGNGNGGNGPLRSPRDETAGRDKRGDGRHLKDSMGEGVVFLLEPSC